MENEINRLKDIRLSNLEKARNTFIAISITFAICLSAVILEL